MCGKYLIVKLILLYNSLICVFCKLYDNIINHIKVNYNKNLTQEKVDYNIWVVDNISIVLVKYRISKIIQVSSVLSSIK